MRNFQPLATGLPTLPLLAALQRKPWLWNAFGVRTWHPESVHRVVDDVVLRYNRFESGIDDFVEAVCSRLEVENYPAWRELPEAQDLIFPLMHVVRGLHLGRVFISRMAPGVEIPLHSDRIAPAEEAFPSRPPPAVYFDRYHVILAQEPGCSFRCGDEEVVMRAGEAWWFNNELLHSVTNHSSSDRISLVCDIHSAQGIYVPSVAKPEVEA